jgi:hypothetical protein
MGRRSQCSASERVREGRRRRLGLVDSASVQAIEVDARAMPSHPPNFANAKRRQRAAPLSA